ncbi:MAG: hypothetical protein ACE5F1_09470 [Planctomycetota bacterium]
MSRDLFLVCLCCLPPSIAAASQDSRPGSAAKPRSRLASKTEVAKLLRTADEVSEQVAELRGWRFKREVKKGVYDEAELKKFIGKALFEEMGEGQLERHQWMLQELGLLPGGMDLEKTIVEVLLNQVGGFYDPKRNSFFMMAKTARYGEFVNRMMIAHELTHALDDQYFDLDAKMNAAGKDHDDEFAIGSVVEGSATVLMFRWQKDNRHLMSGPAEMKKMMQSEMERSKVLFEAPAYFLTLIARYMVGAHFLSKGKSMLQIMTSGSVGDAVKEALESPPVSSEQILHPEKYWNQDKIDLPVTMHAESRFTRLLCESLGAELAGTDCLGEIHCAILGRKPGRKLNIMLMSNASYWTNKAGQGWGGDRVFLLRRGREKGIAWVTWWDTEKDAEEFQARYEKHYGGRVDFRSARDGRLALFTYGFCKDRAGALLDLVRRAGKARKGTEPFPLTDEQDR